MSLIAFVKANEFYLSAWRRQEPELAEKALVGIRDKRAYEVSPYARGRGVRRGMPQAEVKRLLRGEGVLKECEPDEDWAKTTDWLRTCLEFSEKIEAPRPEYAWIDFAGHADPRAALDELLAKLCHSGCDSLTVGAAPHRWLARLVATPLDPKAAGLGVPSYVYISAPAEFLAERAVKDLKPLPFETRELLARLGFNKVAQVQGLAYKVLKGQFGQEALKVREVAAGRWPDPVTPNYPPGSETVSLTFEGGLEDREALGEACRRVCDQMHERLLVRSRETSKLTLVLSGEKAPRLASKTATRPFRTRRHLQAAADEILRRLNPQEAIYSLRLMAEELTERVTPQLSFEPRNKPRERKLSAANAVHYLKKAYGHAGPTLARDVRLPHRERVLMEWRRAYGEP